MAKTKKVDLSWVHRHAGLVAQFQAQDQQAEWGDTRILETTTIIGQVPDKEIWIVECAYTCTDMAADGEYWWTEEDYVAVYKQENGEPFSRQATDEEVALFVES